MIFSNNLLSTCRYIINEMNEMSGSSEQSNTHCSAILLPSAWTSYQVQHTSPTPQNLFWGPIDELASNWPKTKSNLNKKFKQKILYKT